MGLGCVDQEDRQTHRCEWEGVRLEQGGEETGDRREGRATGSHFVMFRHFLGPPCSRLLLRLPAGHFQKVWFLLQHLGDTNIKFL